MLFNDGVLDSNDKGCCFRTNVDVLNNCFGTNKTNYFMACYPQKKGELFNGINTDDKFFVWMPKLYGNSSLWNNGISSDGNLLYEIAEKERTSDWVEEGKHEVDGLRIVFVKPDRKSPYRFVGVFATANIDYCHHLYIKVASRIRLVGSPVESIELLDDYRNNSDDTFRAFSALSKYYDVNDAIKSGGGHNRIRIGKDGMSKATFLGCSRVGWICLYYDKQEKKLVDKLGFKSEPASSDESYDYRAHVDFNDFDRLLKNIKTYLNRDFSIANQMYTNNSEKVLFCNIAYMKYYKGIRPEDKPVNGGSYIKETGDCFEKYNFSQLQDNMYGFVETKHRDKKLNELCIENIDKQYKGKDYIDDVTVIFCARDRDSETVIVGWYDNAIVYRNYIDITRNGEHLRYNIFTHSDDAYLIKTSDRSFVVPRVKKSGDVGFGQSNVWYAKEDKDKAFREKALQYIADLRNKYNGKITDDIAYCENVYKKSDLKETEKQILAKARIGQGDFRDRLIQRDESCVLCGLKNRNLLYASHIKPWSVCKDSNEKLDSNNGLLLCAIHDALFDKGLITFDENGVLLISESVSEDDRELLALKDGFVLKMNDSMKSYMKWHHDNAMGKSNRVFHNKFGYGEIIDETKDTIKVRFDDEVEGSERELSKVVLKNETMKKIF